MIPIPCKLKTALRAVILFSGMLLFLPNIAGQDLESILDQQAPAEETYEPRIFRSHTVANGHSVTMLPAKTVDFRIEHRFGKINSGLYEFFGLDNASIHLSLEYGITDWLMVGAGRGTFEKTYDAYIKLKPLAQAQGSRNIPVSVTYQSALYVNTLRFLGDFDDYRFGQRIEHVHQLMIARQFGNFFSVQLTPSYLRRDPNPAIIEQQNLFALGASFSIRVLKDVSLTAEYYPLLNKDDALNAAELRNPLSFGIDLETGGHIFQLIFTNSLAMTEHGMIGNTTGSWLDGDIHFGFNISRVFQF